MSEFRIAQEGLLEFRIEISDVIAISGYNLTLAPNSTTNIIIGEKTLYSGVMINYAASRGAIHQMGEVFILNVLSGTYHTWDYSDDDIGLTITSRLIGNYIIMTCVVDNSSTDNIEFDYVKELIDS